MNKLYILLEGKESVLQGCLTMPNIVNKDRNAEIIYFPITPSINLVLIFSPKSFNLAYNVRSEFVHFYLIFPPTTPTPLIYPHLPMLWVHSVINLMSFFLTYPNPETSKGYLLYLNFFAPILKSICTALYMALLLC